MESEYILPIEKNPESVTYLFYSTRLAILQAFPVYREWLQQFFLDLKVYYNETQFNYFFMEEHLEDALSFERLSYEEVDEKGIDIIVYSRQNIAQGNYINIHLDEYYLSAKDGYHLKHYVHENLIYGYNDKKKVFYAYGFTRRQKMKVFQIPYKEYYRAYAKGKVYYQSGAHYLKGDYPWPVILCHPLPIEPYEFTLKELLGCLERYLHPKKSEMIAGDLHIYGVNVYEYIIDFLEKQESGDPVDFRTFQLLYEHKKCVKKRIEFVIKKYQLEDITTDIVKGYEEVISGFQRIRLIYLKQLMAEGVMGTFDQTVQDEKTRKNVAKELRRWREKESVILELLYTKLSEKY